MLKIGTPHFIVCIEVQATCKFSYSFNNKIVASGEALFSEICKTNKQCKIIITHKKGFSDNKFLYKI